MRLLLGLEPLNLAALGWMASGVLLSWIVAEVFSRVVWSRHHQEVKAHQRAR
jgi:hypothetical protein